MAKIDPFAFKGSSKLINGVHQSRLCGWRPDEKRTAAFRSENGTLFQANPSLAMTENKDVSLWLPLMSVLPRWQRDAQGIGSCVAWGAELTATMIMAIQHVKGTGQFVAEAATEPIYGGCRVEALGKKAGGYQDGATGSWAAKWLRDWGCILRLDYSQQTKNAEHDLRTYDVKKEKEWGNFGCGGRNDNDMLDGAARVMPIQHVVACESVAEAAAAVSNLYPLTIASMAGFGDMKRDANGICRRVGQWAHQMMIGGIRYRAGAPQFRCFQSWGPKSCSGPDPGITHPAISGCSWWITAEDMEWILRTGDCWIMGDIKGLPRQSTKLAEPLSHWYQPNRNPLHTLAV